MLLVPSTAQMRRSAGGLGPGRMRYRDLHGQVSAGWLCNADEIGQSTVKQVGLCAKMRVQKGSEVAKQVGSPHYGSGT